jgi:hypothetical protein
VCGGNTKKWIWRKVLAARLKCFYPVAGVDEILFVVRF